MRADCHIHMVLDGVDWKASIARGIDDDFIHKTLARYQALGYTYLRDGGDRFGAGARARELAGAYGITYRSPLAPLCKAGHYGGFIGCRWSDLEDFARLVEAQKAQGADFVKIMLSGLMDFDQFGALTQPGLDREEICALIDIIHSRGLSVMAHCNGARTALAAAEAGVDSIEHGAYLDEEALTAMAENRVIWVPTLSTIGNLLGKGRFSDSAVSAILESARKNVALYHRMGGLIAPGTDAGAWAVPHGCCTEEAWLSLPEDALEDGIRAVMERF